MKVLIGSRALQHWHPDFPLSKNADCDVISDAPIPGTEWHDPNILANALFAEQYASGESVEFIDSLGETHQLNVMNMVGLAIIKRSHLWRDLSFQKHITHYHRHLAFYLDAARIQCKTTVRLLEARTWLTLQKFPQGNPNLMQKKDDFFSDAVVKKYEHDWLHELFAFNDKPLYTMLLRHEDMAWCDKDKWKTFTIEEKLQCVAEEAYVIAAERFLIPNDWKYPSKLAFNKAVDKICTTLCSGWFRDFAIDNYPRVLMMYSKEKFEAVKQTIEATPINEWRFYNGK